MRACPAWVAAPWLPAHVHARVMREAGGIPRGPRRGPRGYAPVAGRDRAGHLVPGPAPARPHSAALVQAHDGPLRRALLLQQRLAARGAARAVRLMFARDAGARPLHARTGAGAPLAQLPRIIASLGSECAPCWGCAAGAAELSMRPRTPAACAERPRRSIMDSAACRTPAAPRVHTSEPAEHVLLRGMASNIHDSSSLRRPLPTSCS